MDTGVTKILIEECPVCGFIVYQSDYPEPDESVKYVSRYILCERCEYEARESGEICSRCGQYKPGDVQLSVSPGVDAQFLCSKCREEV